MRFELQRHFFITVLFAFLFAIVLIGQVTHAGYQVLADGKTAVVAEINLIEEIFGEGALQTEINRMDIAPKLDTFEQILLAHASSAGLFAAESALDDQHVNLSTCVPIASVVCDGAMSACDLVGDSE